MQVKCYFIRRQVRRKHLKSEGYNFWGEQSHNGFRVLKKGFLGKIGGLEICQ